MNYKTYQPKKCKHRSWAWYAKAKIFQCQWCNETKTTEELQNHFLKSKNDNPRKNS